MSNFRETIQQFLKGIDSRIPPERVGPDRPIKLQNARLFKRGETGFITRIKGFVRLLRPFVADYEKSHDMTPVAGNVDTSEYLKGYRVSFVETLTVGDGIVGIDKEHQQLVDAVEFHDYIITSVHPLDFSFVETLTLAETRFRNRIVPVLSFTDGLVFSEVVTRSNYVDLSFTDTMQLIDNPMQLQ